ncbi:MAG: ABC transporter permease [bacterium]|nr:ABC transporter permease [bacterium]MDE0440158.1 ABC transporter permease [bacterium]
MTATTASPPSPGGWRRGLAKLRRRPITSAGFVGVVIIYLFAPLIVMVAFSFNSSPRLSFPFAGFSLRWYEEIFTDTLVLRAFRRSLQAAVVTAGITGVLGLLAALGILKIAKRARGFILAISAVPLAVPGLLFSIGLAIMYRQVGFDRSIWAATLGHALIALPFVFLVVGASLERFRFTLIEAAQDLGATRWHAFRTVTLPLILPAVLGAMMLAAAISIDDFVIAFFTAGQDKTLPLIMYGRVLKGIDPTLNAIGTVMLVLTTSLAFMAARRTTIGER